METYVIGITGASGAPYARRVLQALLELGHHVKLVVSPAGERVLDIELGLRFSGSRAARQAQWIDFMGAEAGNLELLAHRDHAASIASGSFPIAGMAVVPCSMGTLSRIATGASTNLIERAADVALKERRRLVLVPRETPLNRIHLRNMLEVVEAGAELLPAMPGFYHHPRNIDDLVDTVAGRVLDRLGVENDMFKRWQGDPLAGLTAGGE
jgi:4-hydroxy-3-polyprenylbenzoate decarboxylase